MQEPILCYILIGFRSFQEHVVCLFEAYGCLAVVSGVYNGLFGQCKELLSYGGDKLIVVAVGEIGAAYTAVEEGIAAEEHLLLWNVVDKAAG